MNKIMNRAEIYDCNLWESFFCSSNPAFITSDCTHITSTNAGKRSLFYETIIAYVRKYWFLLSFVSSEMPF